MNEPQASREEAQPPTFRGDERLSPSEKTARLGLILSFIVQAADKIGKYYPKLR